MGRTHGKHVYGRRKSSTTKNVAYELPSSTRKAKCNPRRERANDGRQKPIHDVSRKKINQAKYA